MSIFNGVLWGYVEKWGNKVISLLVFIVLARLLEPEDFGLVVFARLFIDYIEMLAGQGLDATIIQRKKVTDIYLSTAFWINVVLSLVLVMGVYAVSAFIEVYFSQPSIADILRTLIFVAVLNALSRIQVAILLRQQKFKGLALRGLLMALIGGSVGIFSAYNGLGVWSMVTQQITSAVVAVIVLWGASDWRPKFSFSYAAAKDMYGFATKIIIDQHVLFFSKRLDEALIATFLGVTMLGLYSVAKRLLDVLVDMIYSTLNKVLLPCFSEKQGDIRAVIRDAKKVSLVVTAFSFPIFLGAVCLSDELVIVLFTNKWIEAAPAFRILIASGVFLLMPYILHTIFNAIGKPEISLKLNILRAGMSIVFIALLYPHGLQGIAAAILLSHMLGAAFDVKYLNVLLNGAGRLMLRDQLRYLLCCLPMVLIIVSLGYLPDMGIGIEYLLIIKIMTGIFIYVVTLLLSNDQLIRPVLAKLGKAT